MIDERPTGPIARETLSDRADALTLRLDRYAGGLADRLEGFGVARAVGDSPLLDALTHRWTLPEHLDGGLELFDLDTFAAWGADWTVRTGYDDIVYGGAETGFVIPVDVVAVDPDLAPRVSARSARRAPRPTESRLRPVAAPRREAAAVDRPLVQPGADAPEADRADLFERVAAPAPRRAAVARERYRAAGAEGLTPYPAAMGRAGALDASMLKFPAARARLAGDRPAIIEATPAIDLTADGGGFAPAARGAERGVQALVDRLVPGAPAPIAGWLMPVDAAGRPLDRPAANVARADGPRALGTAAPASTIPAASRQLGRWQPLGAGLAFAVPENAAGAPLGVADRADALARAVFDRVDGAAPRSGDARLYELEQPGVLVEPATAALADLDRAVEPGLAPTRPAPARPEPPRPVERRADDPRREVVRPAEAARDAARPEGRVAPRAAETRADGAPIGSPPTIDRAALAARAAGVAPRGDDGGAPVTDIAARSGDRAAQTRAARTRGAARARGGLARGISERFARPTAEPQLASRSLLLDALVGADAPGARAPLADVGPAFVAGRSAAAFLDGAVGAAVGRFADRLAVGVGGEPGAAAAWSLAPSGELIAPIADRDVFEPGRPVGRVAPSPAVGSPMSPVVGRAPSAALDRLAAGPVDRASPLAGSTSEPASAQRGPGRDAAPSATAVELLRDAWQGGPGAVGEVSRAAAALAGQVGARLDAMVGAEDGSIATGVVERLTAALSSGPRPALLDALQQFERADDAASGAQVWRRISSLAELGPDAPALVRPVLEALGASEAAVERATQAARQLETRRAEQQAEQRAVERQAEQRQVEQRRVEQRQTEQRRVEQQAEQRQVEQRRVEQQVEQRQAAQQQQTARQTEQRRVEQRRVEQVEQRQAEQRQAEQQRQVEQQRRQLSAVREAERAAFAVVARRMGRLAAQAPTAIAAQRWTQWAAAVQPSLGRPDAPSIDVGGPQLAGWVIDPTGQRWIRPRATIGDALPDGVPASIAQGGVRSEALAEQIAAALGPAAFDEGRGARTFDFAGDGAGEVAGQVVRPGEVAAAATGRAGAGRAATGAAPAAGAASSSSAARSPSMRAGVGAAIDATRLIERAGRLARAVGRPGAVGRVSEDIADALVARPAALRGRRGAYARASGAATDSALPISEGGALVSPAQRGSGRLADTRGSAADGRSLSRRSILSSMDAAALVESDALVAAEARMPDRLAAWWRAATAPTASGEGAEAAFADAAAARVVVAPFGAARGGSGEPEAGGSGRSSARSTAAAAISIYEQAAAGVRGGARAAAVGRMTSPTDLGELFEPSAPPAQSEPLGGLLFGDRGPQALTAPGRPRVLVETGASAMGGPLRSAAGETPGRSAEKNEESRHRLAEQMEGDLSPEEIEEIAEEVLGMLRREVEFDMARLGEDEWD